MAWPKLRNRRSSTSQTDDHNGAAREPTSEAPAREPAPWPQQAWTRDPEGDSAAAPSQAPADVPETAPDAAADVRFWSWAKPAEPGEAEDPADALPPDRPEDPEYRGGPDPEYRSATAAAGPDDWPGARRAPVVTPVADAGEEREGIGQHLGNLAHLSADPRMRAWQRRAIIAIIVGLVLGFLLKDWRWGLTFAVLAAIADTIYRSRTVFSGPDGASLTAAQRRTVRQLARLERKGYRALHRVPIPNSDDQVDHVVIGPAGVFAIDSVTWDKRTPVRTSSHRQLWHGSANMGDRLEHSRWESEQVADVLSGELGHPVSVRPAMAVYGPKIPWQVATIRDVDTFSGPSLRTYLRDRARKVKGQRLSRSEVERIDKAAHVALMHEAAS
jgi:Nuclease-related domain